ncbi:MAG: signal recognition particle protein [Bacilli bacterium]|nr:signal recognition particle protein [Bacillales bacterium]MDY2745908.1 signal recognition particle protein [Bacilli bacterium]MDY3889568.1 signal recognition particle protein [Bacilli bacterium]MDY6142372.1 signal recognition particle protein [Bacilli bacterium]
MAFESLSDRFQGIIKKVKGQSKLTEANMEEMLKEIRVALLEADVNFKVVKEFVNNVKEKALGQEVFLKVSPSQMIVKIVHDELEALLGADQCEIKFEMNKPTVIMMCGLQGSGKTTHTGKLALLFKNKLHKKVLLVAGDVYRPAAIDQLQTIANQVGVDILNLGDKVSPVEIACRGVKKAYDERYDVVIIDTAGRLAIDEKLMQELVDIEEKVKPTEELLLVDAMSGQDAVNVAKAFNEKLHLTGMIMSKLDGDARGGAALSIKHLTGIPIKYAGVGEKLEDLEVFHPDRMADRILGMGDVVSLVEKVQEQIDEKQAKKTVNKMMSGHFDLNDMLAQMEQINKLGSMGGLLKLIPGMPKISEEDQEKAKKQMDKTKAIIFSMTPQERKDPSIIKNSRKVRIARGCGMTNQDVNRVLNQYDQMKKMMKEMGARTKGGKFPPFGGFGGKNPFGM